MAMPRPLHWRKWPQACLFDRFDRSVRDEHGEMYDVIHLHPFAPPKPAEGKPCNGCGVCCASEPCPIGILVSRRRTGTCSALLWNEGEARYRCGVVADPSAYLPRVLKTGGGDSGEDCLALHLRWQWLRLQRASGALNQWGLTFDMGGGTRVTKRPLAYSLDGGVRHLHSMVSV